MLHLLRDQQLHRLELYVCSCSYKTLASLRDLSGFLLSIGKLYVGVTFQKRLEDGRMKTIAFIKDPDGYDLISML